MAQRTTTADLEREENTAGAFYLRSFDLQQGNASASAIEPRLSITGARRFPTLCNRISARRPALGDNLRG